MDELNRELDILLALRAHLLLLTAFISGAVIGLEREYAQKPAGLRTNILICLGSCLFTIASQLAAVYVAHEPREATRIAAGVVTGIGFLGAAAVLREGLRVTGITTAATIWLVAAVGLVIGIGFPFFGLAVSGLATVCLFILGKIEFNSFPNTHRS